uniref:Uncharacterized protein n=1 Tax=Sinocyclocheilus rhinocerous TaxID=307959 RepID=A0A673LLF9_9TELE
PGVLQRLDFTYFVLELMQTFSPHREIPLREVDLVLHWPEWIFIVLLETMWLCLTFLLGYLGAGGIGDDGLYPNCTERAPFEPEGVLGTINSIVIGFFGINIYHISVVFFGSLSFVTCMGCMSFVLLGVMYFIVDVKEWCQSRKAYSAFAGMNSIFVYVGHSLLGFYFPFSWEMRFQDSHWEQLFQSIWGTALWVFIAYLLYRKNIYIYIYQNLMLPVFLSHKSPYIFL